MTTAHLTPTELDALLQAATALDEHWELHHGEHSLRVCNGQHDALGGCQALVEAEIVGHSRWSSESRAKFVSVANPATVTRLVLMVRELQRIESLYYEQVEANQMAQVSVADVVEHFRARAVRAIESKYGLMNHDYFAELIKSLPLVETEDDNAV